MSEWSLSTDCTIRGLSRQRRHVRKTGKRALELRLRTQFKTVMSIDRYYIDAANFMLEKSGSARKIARLRSIEGNDIVSILERIFGHPLEGKRTKNNAFAGDKSSL